MLNMIVNYCKYRELLIIFGWLLKITNYFDNYRYKIIEESIK
jgi:hypothetical protein